MQLPLLGPCIQSYFDENEMVEPHALLSHSESSKTVSSIIVLIQVESKDK